MFDILWSLFLFLTLSDEVIDANFSFSYQSRLQYLWFFPPSAVSWHLFLSTDHEVILSFFSILSYHFQPFYLFLSAVSEVLFVLLLGHSSVLYIVLRYFKYQLHGFWLFFLWCYRFTIHFTSRLYTIFLSASILIFEFLIFLDFSKRILSCFFPSISKFHRSWWLSSLWNHWVRC